MHPVLKKTIGELLEELPAGQAVRRVAVEAKDRRPTTDRLKEE
jgi:hypothetical protein